MSVAVLPRPRRLLQMIMLRIRLEVLEWSGTWWFLMTLVVQAVLGPLIGLFVWSAVYPADPYVATYYVALLLVTVMTESFEQFTFSEKIYDGTISHDLLRPQPAVINAIGTNIAIRTWLTIMGIPVAVLAGLPSAYPLPGPPFWLPSRSSCSAPRSRSAGPSCFP